MRLMKIMVSKRIIELYKETNKNLDYALNSIVNSFDPECYEKAMRDVAEIRFNSEKVPVDVSESVMQIIKDSFCEDSITNGLIEVLLWIAVLFPEI